MPSSNELLKAQKILNPKFKILSFSIISTTIFIVIWSIFAKIPNYSNAIGYKVPAFQLKTLKSATNGKLILLGDKESKKIYEILLELSLLTRLNKSNYITNDESISTLNNINRYQIQLNKLNKLIFYLEDLFYEKKDKKDDFISNKGDQKTKFACYRKDFPIFYIFNSEDKNEVLNLIDDSLTKVLNLKSKLKSVSSIANQRNSLIVDLNTSIRDIQNSLGNFLEKAFVSAEKDSCLANQYIKNGESVLKGEKIVMTKFIEGIRKSKRNKILDNKILNKIYWEKTFSKTSDLSNQIPFFYLSDNDEGINNNQESIVYPSNIARSKYGGIKGKVIVSKYSVINENHINLVLGLENIKPFNNKFKEGKAIYFGVIELEKNPKNFTGLNWTGGEGPNFPILYGTDLDVIIKVNYESPLSKLFPKIK